MIVYDWSRKPQEAFRADAAAAIVVLLVITLLANGIADLPAQSLRAGLVMPDTSGDSR